jgi:hypothetical protein
MTSPLHHAHCCARASHQQLHDSPALHDASTCMLTASALGCRAMVELHKALDENAVCRSPLLDGHQTRDEVRAGGGHTAGSC